MKLFTGKKGFTIVELVIVIAVIAILAAVLIPTFNSVIAKANESAALQKAQTALQVVTMENGGTVADDTYFIVGTDYAFKYTKTDGLKVEKSKAADVTTLKTGLATTHELAKYSATGAEKNEDLENLKIDVYVKKATA